MSRTFKAKPTPRKKFFTYDSREDTNPREAWRDEMTLEDLHAAKVIAGQIKARVEAQA